MSYRDTIDNACFELRCLQDELDNLGVSDDYVYNHIARIEADLQLVLIDMDLDAKLFSERNEAELCLD